LSPATAQRAIALAVLVNTAVKAAMAVSLGGSKVAQPASAALGAALLIGALTAFATL
jgi:uncharacterized membrane protein (DUF4010 family)